MLPEPEAPARPVKATMHKPGVVVVHVTFSHGLDSHDPRRALFDILDRYRPAVNMMTSSDIGMSFLLADAGALGQIRGELCQFGAVRVKSRSALIGIAGEGLRHTKGVAARVFGALDDIDVLFQDARRLEHQSDFRRGRRPRARGHQAAATMTS